MNEQTARKKMTPARLLVGLFVAALSISSAATSFLLFVDIFGADAFNAFGIAMGGYGSLLTDVAAIGWLTAYLNMSENGERKTASIIGAMVGFGGSVLASAVFLLKHSADFTLSANSAENVTIAFALVLTVHLMLVFWFVVSSEENKQQVLANDLLAEANHVAALESDKHFRSHIPTLARANGIRQMLALAEQFGGVEMAQEIKNQILIPSATADKSERQTIIIEPSAEPASREIETPSDSEVSPRSPFRLNADRESAEGGDISAPDWQRVAGRIAERIGVSRSEAD